MADIGYIPPSSYQSPTLMGVIGNKAADMWASEGQRLYQQAEQTAQLQEAQANAPAISQAYAQGINKIYQGDTTGFHDLTQASAMSVGNPFLESMTRQATSQGVQAMDRWMAEQMAGRRQGLANENDLIKYDQAMDISDAAANRQMSEKAALDQQRYASEKAQALNFYQQTGQVIPVAPAMTATPLPQRQYLSQTMRKLHGQGGMDIAGGQAGVIPQGSLPATQGVGAVSRGAAQPPPTPSQGLDMSQALPSGPSDTEQPSVLGGQGGADELQAAIDQVKQANPGISQKAATVIALRQIAMAQQQSAKAAVSAAGTQQSDIAAAQQNARGAMQLAGDRSALNLTPPQGLPLQPPTVPTAGMGMQQPTVPTTDVGLQQQVAQAPMMPQRNIPAVPSAGPQLNLGQIPTTTQTPADALEQQAAQAQLRGQMQPANMPASQLGPTVGAPGALPGAPIPPAKPVIAGLTDRDLDKLPEFAKPLGPQGPTVKELRDRTDLAPEGSNLKITLFGADTIPKKTPVVEAKIGGEPYKAGGDDNPLYQQARNVRDMFSGLTAEPLQALNDALANTPRGKVPDIQMVPINSADKDSPYKMTINGNPVNMIDPKAANLNPDQLKALPGQGLVPAVFPKDMGDKWRGVGKDNPTPVKADMDNLAKLGYFHIEPGTTQAQIDGIWQKAMGNVKNAYSTGGDDAGEARMALENKAFGILREGDASLKTLKDIRPDDVNPPTVSDEVAERAKQMGITLPGHAELPVAMDYNQELAYVKRRISYLKGQQSTAKGPDLNDVNNEIVQRLQRQIELEKSLAPPAGGTTALM